MNHRHVVVAGLLTVVVGVWALTAGVAGQEAASGADDYAPGQTPWGDPDLQGIWGAGYIFTPLERPDDFEGREFLSDDEAVSLEQRQASTFGIGAGAGRGQHDGASGARHACGSPGRLQRRLHRARHRGHCNRPHIAGHRPTGRQDPVSGGGAREVADRAPARDGRHDGQSGAAGERPLHGGPICRSPTARLPPPAGTSGSSRRRATLRSTTSTATTAGPTVTWRSTDARIRRTTSGSGWGTRLAAGKATPSSWRRPTSRTRRGIRAPPRT